MLEVQVIAGLMIALLVSLMLYIEYVKFSRFNQKIIGRRNQRRHKSYGYVYFYTHKIIWRVFPVMKIGRAGKTEQRLRPQQTPSPFGLKILAIVMVADEIKSETYIHRRYKFERIYNDRRNEWFWITPRLYLFMSSVRDNKLTKQVRLKL